MRYFQRNDYRKLDKLNSTNSIYVCRAITQDTGILLYAEDRRLLTVINDIERLVGIIETLRGSAVPTFSKAN